MISEQFLTAEWRDLAMLNYEIDPALLRSCVPAGTELDLWNRKTYCSMVGFRFLNTRVMRVAIPFHTDFEEVNLRFYVRHKSDEGWRRGVVFIKEIVPRPAIAAIARWFYHEKYVALGMHHTVISNSVEYRWLWEDRWNRIHAKINGEPNEIPGGSEAEFILEHYWGYSAQLDGGTVEYQVEHPRWRVWNVSECLLDCDVATLYGPEFAAALNQKPASAFVAEGSPIVVYRGNRIV